MSGIELETALCKTAQDASTSCSTPNTTSPFLNSLIRPSSHGPSQSSRPHLSQNWTTEREQSCEEVVEELIARLESASEAEWLMYFEPPESVCMLRNFNHDVTGNEDAFVRVRGSPEAVNKLENAVHNGFQAIQTSNMDQQGLLNALDLCLSGLHRGDGRYAATVSEMREAIRSDHYAGIVFDRHPDLDQATIYDRFYVDGNHTLDQADLLLYLLGRYTGEVYELGVVRMPYALGAVPAEHEVFLRPPLYAQSPTATIFVYNQVYQTGPHPEALGYWFAMVACDSGSFNNEMTTTMEDPHNLPVDCDETGQKLEGAAASVARAKMVPLAPPYDSLLPFQYMQGITSRELIDFFPNHCLHWPAISARVVLDGWSFKDIERRVKEVRGFNISANSILNSMTKCCRRISDDANWNISRYRSGESTLPVNELQTVPWMPIDQSKAGRYPFKYSWTLGDIGLPFKSMERGVPGHGKFRDRIEAALIDGTDASKPEASDDQALFNPPELPPNWLLGIPSNAYTKQQNVDAEEPNGRGLQEVFALFTRPSRHGEHASAELRDRILADTDCNPEQVIGRYSKFLTGEVLLWLLSRGAGKGNMETITICESLQRHFGDPSKPSKVVCHRTTISKRKGEALKARALANNTTYDHEFKEFECKEAFHARGGARSRRDDENPIRRRDKRARSEPYKLERRKLRFENKGQGEDEAGGADLDHWNNVSETGAKYAAAVQHTKTGMATECVGVQMDEDFDVDQRLREVAEWVREH